MTIKYYDKSDCNPYCFFQPPFAKALMGIALELSEQADVLPNPLDKHRIPRPRLVPPGSLNRG